MCPEHFHMVIRSRFSELYVLAYNNYILKSSYGESDIFIVSYQKYICKYSAAQKYYYSSGN